jgi:hypothetical protein
MVEPMLGCLVNSDSYFLPFIFTNSAISTAIRFYVGVLWCKFMTVFAVGLRFFLSCRADSPECVHLNSYNFKVVRVNTFAISAEVIYGHPLWDGINKKF